MFCQMYVWGKGGLLVHLRVNGGLVGDKLVVGFAVRG